MKLNKAILMGRLGKDPVIIDVNVYTVIKLGD